VKTSIVAGQPSWRLRSKQVDAWLTRTGGHLGPVSFRLGKKTVQPYAVAPWAEEKVPSATLPVIRVLRGDFFCVPFGTAGPPFHRGELHPMHGAPGNANWLLPALARTGDLLTFRTEMPLRFRAGKIVKELTLHDRQSVVYNRHLLSRVTGPLTFATHPCLDLTGTNAIISTSAIRMGQVFPGGLAGDRSALKIGAFFRKLSRVPLAAGGHTDASRYPARPGFEDLVQVAARATDSFAWTAVTVPERGYVWFTLKDPRILPATLFWFSNGGLDAPPCNGRLRGILGVEEICSYFASGVVASLKRNSFSSRGCPTIRTLKPGQTLDVRTITGVAAVSSSFGRVVRIVARSGGVTLVSTTGRRVRCALDHGFLKRVLPVSTKVQS